MLLNKRKKNWIKIQPWVNPSCINTELAMTSTHLS